MEVVVCFVGDRRARRDASGSEEDADVDAPALVDTREGVLREVDSGADESKTDSSLRGTKVNRVVEVTICRTSSVRSSCQ